MNFRSLWTRPMSGSRWKSRGLVKCTRIACFNASQWRSDPFPSPSLRSCSHLTSTSRMLGPRSSFHVFKFNHHHPRPWILGRPVFAFREGVFDVGSASSVDESHCAVPYCSRRCIHGARPGLSWRPSPRRFSDRSADPAELLCDINALSRTAPPAGDSSCCRIRRATG